MPTQRSNLVLLLVPALAMACGAQPPRGVSGITISTSWLETLPLLSSAPSSPLRWPQFLVADGASGFFLGGGRDLFRIATLASHSAVAEPVVAAGPQQGLGRLVAAAQSPGGTLAFLDETGQVAIHGRAPGQRWLLKTRDQNRSRHLTVSEGSVYLLLEGETETGNAVAMYNFTGTEVRRWGVIPADGIVQGSLTGGGIAACPDGSIFYSYLNSPRVFHLDEESSRAVRAIGEPSSSFQTISAGQVRRALRESTRSHSVAPLVKLGLGASRVMSLLCSDDGLLFREVAHPKGRGAEIEVWDPLSEERVGTIPAGNGVLLAVRDQILYLVTAQPGEKLALERIRYQVKRSQPGKADG